MQWFSGKRHAGKLARVVWEGGNGKGLEGTSPVPYFILRGRDDGNIILLPDRSYLGWYRHYVELPLVALKKSIGIERQVHIMQVM